MLWNSKKNELEYWQRYNVCSSSTPRIGTENQYFKIKEIVSRKYI